MAYIQCTKCGQVLDSGGRHKCQTMEDVVMKKAREEVEKVRSTIRDGYTIEEPVMSERAVMFLSVVALLDKIIDERDGVSYDD